MKANTGTCPACDRVMKLKGGLIVNHGFTVREGVRIGQCPGVGQKPWEVSPEGRIHHIKELKDHRTRLQQSDTKDQRLIDQLVGIVTKKIATNQFLVDRWEPEDLP